MEEKKYFYSNGTDRLGPFTLSELRYKNITRHTLIWFNGMTEWQEACTIPELSTLFDMAPPPINPKNGSNQRSRPPRTWLVESILVTLFCCLPLGAIGILYASRVESAYARGEYALADRYSRQAGRWIMLAFGLLITSFIIYYIIGLTCASIPFFFLFN